MGRSTGMGVAVGRPEEALVDMQRLQGQVELQQQDIGKELGQGLGSRLHHHHLWNGLYLSNFVSIWHL